VRTLLEAATRAGIPWLVVEPAKAEYRLMAAGRASQTRSRPGSTRLTPRRTPKAAGFPCRPTRTSSRRCSSRPSAQRSRFLRCLARL
jgi:hypothetical protein